MPTGRTVYLARHFHSGSVVQRGAEPLSPRQAAGADTGPGSQSWGPGGSGGVRARRGPADSRSAPKARQSPSAAMAAGRRRRTGRGGAAAAEPGPASRGRAPAGGAEAAAILDLKGLRRRESGWCRPRVSPRPRRHRDRDRDRHRALAPSRLDERGYRGSVAPLGGPGAGEDARSPAAQAGAGAALPGRRSLGGRGARWDPRGSWGGACMGLRLAWLGGRGGSGTSGAEGSVRAVPSVPAVALRAGAEGAGGSADFGAGERRPAGSAPSGSGGAAGSGARPCPLCSGSSGYAGSVLLAAPRAGPAATQGRPAEAGSPRGRSGVCVWQPWVSPKSRPWVFPGCCGRRLRDSLLYN